MKIRGQDDWGNGAYDAPRGDHRHEGVDVCCEAGELIRSLTYGKVSKIGWCYDWSDYPGRKHMRYVEVALDGNFFRYLYVTPSIAVGDHVSPGAVLGASIDLDAVFPKIIQHVHIEHIEPSGLKVNPLRTIITVQDHGDL